MAMLKIGDKVKYNPEFLRSTGLYRDFAKERGVIVHITHLSAVQLCEIEWLSKDTPRKVIAPNLRKVK